MEEKQIKGERHDITSSNCRKEKFHNVCRYQISKLSGSWFCGTVVVPEGKYQHCSVGSALDPIIKFGSYKDGSHTLTAVHIATVVHHRINRHS